MSLILDIATIVVPLATICTSLLIAIRVRRFRKRTEVAAARAVRLAREQRINQHLENSGECARLVNVGERGCALALPDQRSNRPKHPDGTPYRYHEIVAEGWGHCDGCRQWGQWTAEDPHECPTPLTVRTNATVRTDADSAAIGAEVGRILRRTRRDGT